MNIHSLSYDRQYPSALLLSLPLENYSKYFILSIALFHQVSKRCHHFYLLFRRSLSPFFGVASTPVPGVLSAGLDVSLIGSLLHPVQSLSSRPVAPAPGPVNPALFSAVTLRSSAVLLNYSLLGSNLNYFVPLIPSYIKRHYLTGSLA